MKCRLIAFVAALSVARGAIIASPSASAVAVAHPSGTLVRTEAYDANPQYSYSYSVADGITGDNKAQQESRNGDVVQGSYSLVEPDGSRRTVSYAADPINGFNAVVQKDPSLNAHARVVSAASPVLRGAVVAQPVQIVSGQPVLASNRPGTVITSADSNVIRQSTLVAASSPYVTSGLVGVGVRTDGSFGVQSVLDNYGYGSARVVRIH